MILVDCPVRSLFRCLSDPFRLQSDDCELNCLNPDISWRFLATAVHVENFQTTQTEQWTEFQQFITSTYALHWVLTIDHIKIHTELSFDNWSHLHTHCTEFLQLITSKYTLNWVSTIDLKSAYTHEIKCSSTVVLIINKKVSYNFYLKKLLQE